ncbi:transposase family protein [Streptomyces sp. WAC07094]|uniref:transposase family protein n=1 Tax=Streptomyces sp. WAC07094 TaxID=3072183 RepID=UPI002E9ECAD7|nr:transposase family protein [Streptomyces sp. WAC07094]
MRRRVPGAGAGQGGGGGRREHLSTHAHAIPHNPAQTTPTPPTPTPSNSNKAAGPGALSDLGFLGLDKDCHDQVVVTGYKATRARNLTTGQNTANRIIAAGCAPVEHGFAHLKTWRILTKLRTGPARATNLLRASLVLTNLELVR